MNPHRLNPYRLPAPGAPHGAMAPELPPVLAALAQAQPERRCALCRQPVALGIRADSRCPTCHSPLATLPGPDDPAHELLGRRGAVRRDQSHVAMLCVGWPSTPLPVRWRDLSLTGLSFYSPQALPAGQTLRLTDSAIDVVAEVVGCRPQGRVFAVHARLQAALLLQATGVFVSAQA